MTNEPAHAASKQAVVPGMHVTKITFEFAHVPHNQLLNDYDTSSSAIFHLLHRITKEEKYKMSVQSLQMVSTVATHAFQNGCCHQCYTS